MGHANEELLRSAYGARDQQATTSVRDLFHEDVVWHTRGRDLHGPDEVLEMLGHADEVAGGTTTREIHALFADDEYGMVLVTVRAEREARRFEDRQVHVYRFREGRIAEFWDYVGDPRREDEFWS